MKIHDYPNFSLSFGFAYKTNTENGVRDVGGGEKQVKKAVLFLAVALIAVATLATPVLAIGPINAEGNPNAMFLPDGVGLKLPSGMSQQWYQAGGKHLMIKDAREFKINNALVVTSISQVALNENKWLFFSVQMFAQWLVLHSAIGIPYPVALGIVTANWPQGVYYREVLVGK